VDEVHAFLLDEALGVRLRIEDLRASQPRGDLPAGLGYATEADMGDWAAGDDD
jgi:hypothetical protein